MEKNSRMQISFKTKKLQKELEDEKKLITKHGPIQAKLIKKRLMALRALETLNDLWPPFSGPERCHELEGNLKGYLSIDIKHPYRIIIKPNHDPLPMRAQGGLDWSKVTHIEIIKILDTH